jgi:uncharacterized protein (TIGR02145 family)
LKGWLITGNKMRKAFAKLRYPKNAGIWPLMLVAFLFSFAMPHEMTAQSLLPDTVCEGTTQRMYWVSGFPGSTYSWTVEGGTIWPPGNNDTIMVNWSGISSGVYDITVVEHALTGCSGDTITGQVYIVPVSYVNFNPCFDTITLTNAKPIKLKGGIPLGGIYSGPGVINGFFYPPVAGPGNHIITYSYSNTYGCTSFAHSLIHSFTQSLIPCGILFTDIRDGTIYPTVPIGTQCWLRKNLNFGNNIPGNMFQTDNCQIEKYCYNDSLINCTSKGGLYQWDEIMQYETSEGLQGLCPPGWHVPTKDEWLVLLNFFNGAAFAGDALKTGCPSGFDAMLDGAFFANQEYIYGGFATFFWTSTPHSDIKAWSHGFNDPDPGVSTYPSSVQNAFYVRCIRD